MLAEQTLMNAAVLIVEHTSGPELAGFVFNVLLIVRAPLQLFQAVQTSILPHLTALDARENAAAFAAAIRKTVLAIAAFAGACAVALLAIGPWAMELLLGDKGFSYERGGLALVALGMGFHLVAGTLNQAALARRRAPSPPSPGSSPPSSSSPGSHPRSSPTRSSASSSATSAPPSSSAACCSASTAGRRSRKRPAQLAHGDVARHPERRLSTRTDPPRQLVRRRLVSAARASA